MRLLDSPTTRGQNTERMAFEGRRSAFRKWPGTRQEFRACEEMGRFNATKYRGFPLCIRNKKGLAMNSNNHIKNYSIENKIVNLIRAEK
jgi:hypothetical protein